jgi:hypothetical protein
MFETMAESSCHRSLKAVFAAPPTLAQISMPCGFFILENQTFKLKI